METVPAAVKDKEGMYLMILLPGINLKMVNILLNIAYDASIGLIEFSLCILDKILVRLPKAHR